MRFELLNCYIAKLPNRKKPLNNSTIKLFNCGYTLIEFVVVLGILVLTVGALTMFLTAIFKGTNKANINAEVKQNGQAVLDSLERQIRGAVDIEKKLGDNYIKLFRPPAGEPLHIRCDEELPDVHNSRLVLAVVSDEDIAYDDKFLPPNDPNWRSVSNDEPNGGISINECQIDVIGETISPSGISVPPFVSIRFTAERKSERADFTGRAYFRTTISLRQY